MLEVTVSTLIDVNGVKQAKGTIAKKRPFLTNCPSKKRFDCFMLRFG